MRGSYHYNLIKKSDTVLNQEVFPSLISFDEIKMWDL